MNQREKQRQLISIADGANRVGVSKQTIRRRISEGALTAYRFGPRLIKIDSDELDALIRPIPTAAHSW